MISDARGGHVSPGIYTEEKDVTYSVKSLGVTSLGAVGETLKGPAFQNIEIESWSDFVDYFGGTSTEKFKENGRPKYELPYIAKAYLEESKRLNVVRVLGLSGYYAGPVWVLKNGEKPILMLRSKMTYKAISEEGFCKGGTNDTPTAVVSEITYQPYSTKVYDANCNEVSSTTTEQDAFKLGIKVTCDTGATGYQSEYVYNVSLRSTDKDYIYNVLGTSSSEGEAPIYVDSLFENMLGTSGLTFTSETKTEGTGSTTEGETKTEGTAPKFEELLSAGTETNKIDDYYASFLDAFRCAQSPWIVSNVSTDGKNATMKKLFKFLTISDGNAANYQVKVSIENIKPDAGTFTVTVRDFYDSDVAPVVLEKFSNCSLVEGEANFIGLKIGTYDGGYAAKSKYITVMMADDDNLASAVPAGFLGYPSLFGSAITLNYSTEYNPSIKARRQYFGLNSDTIETDILDYKGKYAYTNDDSLPAKLTNGFHLDAILNPSVSAFTSDTIFVDGVSGYTFSTVSPNQVVSTYKNIPRIIDGGYIDSTIYNDIKLRKFTVYLYGGFDGWDVNRGYRTNGDSYKASKYNVSGSTIFGKVAPSGYITMLGLTNDAITTDYYAYLGGYRQFANPQDVDINVFVTPGIDWHNNTLLTEDALDVIEDKEDGRGGDALYIMDSPQYTDNGEQISADELVNLLDDTGIDTSYACTYFPWVKFFDSSAKRYLDIPVTKDVVRNIANTDNNSYPWFAPAGVERGNVSCINAVKKTTLAEEDELYENRINPVKSFAQDGVKIWGNKTLYSQDSPLNRVNVRRLMIRIKKLIVDASKSLIFEQYDTTLEKQFRSIVDPILADVKSNRGIYDYRIVTEVTAETRDEHILPAKILVKPTPALEYISISFVVYPESVDFEEN